MAGRSIFRAAGAARHPAAKAGIGRRAFCGALAVSMMGASLAGAAPPAAAQSTAEMDGTLDQLFGSHQPYQEFFHALKRAVAADDRAGVADMVDYPFKTRIDGKAVTIRDAARFVAGYDKIVTAKIKQAVAAQSYPTLFANWRGVMIGNGEIWFSGVGDKGRIAIIAVNH